MIIVKNQQASMRDIKNVLEKIDPAWSYSTFIFLCSRLTITLLSIILFINQFYPDYYDSKIIDTVTPINTGWSGAVLGMWQRWDGVLYQAIAHAGYYKEFLTAFFPAYPLLGTLVSKILNISEIAALLLISNLFCWLSFVLIYKIAASFFDTSIARYSVIFLAIFPTSFFLYAMYPQSMALFLSLFCYWQAKHKRWFLASLGGLLAGLTHGTVLPLSMLLGWLVYKEITTTKPVFRWTLIFVPLIPLIGVGIFLLWRYSAGFISYSKVLEFPEWQRVGSMPWTTLYYFFKNLISFIKGWISLLNLIMLILLTVCSIWCIRKMPTEITIYVISFMIFALSNRTMSEPLASFNRYILIAFPIFIMFADTTRKKWGRLVTFSISLLSWMILASSFMMWVWIG